MFIVWLAVMGVIVGIVTAVVVWRIGQDTGRWSTRRDMVFVAGVTTLGGVIFSTLLGWVGYLLFGESGALLIGIIGGIIAVLSVLAWSIRSTQKRKNAGTGLAPTRPGPDTETVQTHS
jgi:hypothetical protein